MILIVGSSHDDVLFFESILTEKRSEVLFDRYPIVFGKIYNQEVCLLSEVYTNYISNALILYLIHRYFVYLVINVGTCIGYSSDVHFGDIVLSEKVILGDVDQSPIRHVTLGQIPGFSSALTSDNDVTSFLMPVLNQRILSPHESVTFISSNTFYTKEEQLKPLQVSNHLFGIENGLVLDCTLGGVALASTLADISFIGIKTVEREFTEAVDVERYAEVLKSYVSIGKAVVSCIGDIGRTDILEGKQR